MEKYLYLLVDATSILIPFLFSFKSERNFSLKWKHVVPAIVCPALIFCAWDEWFTSMGVWGFNPQYLTGIYIAHLPLEEVLFFFCIPYACLFTYEAVNHYKRTEPFPNNGRRITWILIVGLLAIAIRDYNHWYTALAFSGTACFLLFLQVVVRPPYLGHFYFAYLFMLIPFFIVNGLLTGTGLPEPVVWYDNAENLGIRMFTIPLEDIFYGMLLVLMNVSIFEYLQNRKSKIL